jgi:hypothetical protein|tara:strand:+ start:828 stop:1424 length:597 start_codon:yes stop_codon:yes gene_type:complete
MPNKDISQLSKDLEQDMIRLRGKVASRMVQDLQAAGPWWTGHFATSWKISETPVEPVTKSKKRQEIDQGKIEGYDASLLEVMSNPDYTGSVYDQIKTTRRLPKRKRPKKIPLEKDMYVGNEAEYAGFAVNNPGATAPVGDPNGVTYSEHEQIVDAITPPSQMPDWYKIYMGNEEFNVVIALAVNETFKGKNVSFDLDP